MTHSFRQFGPEPPLPAYFIARGFRGGMSVVDLLQSQAYIEIGGPREAVCRTNGPLFYVYDHDYSLEANIQDGTLVLIRDHMAASLSLDGLFPESHVFGVRFAWRPRALIVGVVADDGRTEMRKVETPSSIPTADLVRRARAAQLIPTTSYASEEELRERVHGGLSALHDKLIETEMQLAFWDSHREGSRLIGRTPKREVEVQPTIHALLHDFAIQAGIEVIPEYHTGLGDIDFAFQGAIEGIGIRTVCAEFKNAHSADLAHGLEVQLPTYMSIKQAKYGVYCVLCYTGPDFDGPPASRWPALEEKVIAPAFDALAPRFRRGIRVFYFDLTKPPTASRRDHV